MSPEFLFIAIVLAGFYMAWSIGANDVANAMGTSVGSGALSLKQAVIIAAVLEFSGAFFFGSHVTETVQKGIINLEIFAPHPMWLVYGMLASLIGVGIWLQVATYFGWPVSTTHSIVGALIGFGLMAGGMDAVHWDNLGFIFTSWIASPLLGCFLGFVLFTWLRKKILYHPHPLLATKKCMPYLVFVVVSILGLLMFYNGLQNLDLDFTFVHAFFLSLAVGTLAGLFTLYSVRKIVLPERTHSSTLVHPPEIQAALEKAKKQLLQVQRKTPGTLDNQLNSILEEIDSIKESVSHLDDYETSSQEFKQIERLFGYLQVLSACLMAFAHGANDVANAIGPVSAALAVLKSGSVAISAEVPTWTLALGGFGIVVGLATWGWRVIETIGKKLTELTPTRGFAAEFGAALTILLASRLGMPISTTHTLVGAVVGVGLARGIEALNLNTMRDVILSWIVTVPAGAFMTMGIFYLFTILS